MIKINSALVLYFIAVVLFICSFYFKSESLELFSRPVIIPSIYYFYYTSVKGKVNLLFSLSIFSYFLAEILFLISEIEYLIPRLIFNLIPYFAITFFLYQDFLYYFKKKKYKANSSILYLVAIFLLYLLYSVLSLTMDSPYIEFYIYITYAVLLFTIALLCFLIQFNFNNKTILYTILMVICFIISDFFFVFATQMKDIVLLKMIFLITKQLSFFLFTAYYINRTKYILWKKR